MQEVRAAKDTGRFVEGAHLVRAGVPVRVAANAKYLDKELKAAQYFGDLGHQFEITKAAVEAPGADVWLVTEYGFKVGYDVKTLNAASKNALIKTVQTLGNGTVPNAIIDGRNVGLTRATAISWARAGVSRYAKGLQELRIITTEGEVIWQAR